MAWDHQSANTSSVQSQNFTTYLFCLFGFFVSVVFGFFFKLKAELQTKLISSSLGHSTENLARILVKERKKERKEATKV